MIVCHCTLPPECCATCPNNTRILSGESMYYPQPHPHTYVPQWPTPPAFEFTEADKRELSWFMAGNKKHKPLCAYYRNTERGLECTAKNCPCELYEADV